MTGISEVQADAGGGSRAAKIHNTKKGRQLVGHVELNVLQRNKSCCLEKFSLNF